MLRRRIHLPAAAALLVLALPLGALAAPGEPTLRVAYLDPGTGSFILQAVIATLAGLAVTANAYKKKIAEFFARGRRDTEVSEAKSADE